ncbi:DUF2203 domain-containing protein [Paenalkalicoccus suaedae]|uniref:DUF2203 domain-containing protein n=1 Tax=Paenalkalicoccus suaedae TaxID=2592382 RepID=A0A859FGD4_9BACI|nr:DUF2203 domain-containing protein [Paenalkalicoccus suaedae]QKS71286.1 DUF2203 domain-containing protein [Paenalkalicoccus suaedae]
MMPRKYFTVEQANRLIPIVETEIAELKKIQNEFDEKWSAYHQVKENHQQHVQTETESMFKLECQLEFIELQAQLHVKNIQDTGAQLKGIEPGLVDFPSFKEKEEILLCWREGEKEITFYHNKKDGFAGRKPLF